jgi:23S rRNA G2069 N7-methylase RlmK/C1962 C5-methylase RlmI
MEGIMEFISSALQTANGEAGHAAMFVIGLLCSGLVLISTMVRTARRANGWRITRRDKRQDRLVEKERQSLIAKELAAAERMQETAMLRTRVETEKRRLAAEAAAVNGKPVDDYQRLRVISLADKVTKIRRDAAYAALKQPGSAEEASLAQNLMSLTGEFKKSAVTVYPGVWESGKQTGDLYDEIHKILGQGPFDPVHASLVLARIDETVTKST